jgi:plasmid stabilization system protein ParE
MGKVNWTLEAVRWLEDIRDYIARDNPDAALRVVRGIYDKINCCVGSPKSGTLTQPDQIITFAYYYTVTIESLTSSSRMEASIFSAYSTEQWILTATYDS